MGNRALIVGQDCPVGIYVHWNGGYYSVTAFLEWARLRGLPGLSSSTRSMLPLATVIVNFMGNDGRFVDVVPVHWPLTVEDSPGDNGSYVIQGYEIVKRIDGPHQEQKLYPRANMLREIDAYQPEGSQLGEEFIDAQEVPVSSLKVGDQVYIAHTTWEPFQLVPVLGIGEENEIVNGRRVAGVPYVRRYDHSDNRKNPNSYLRSKTVKVAPHTI